MWDTVNDFQHTVIIMSKVIFTKLKLLNAKVQCIDSTVFPSLWKLFLTFLLPYLHTPICLVRNISLTSLPSKSSARWEGRCRAALCEGCSPQTEGNRSARLSNGLLLCEPRLALCNSPLFIFLTSLAGYMLLIKHAARLLIVNQIQFVPWAYHEWASPLRTKVSEQPCQSWTKGPKHHFYLRRPELLLLVGSHWMRSYPGRFPGRCSRDAQRKLSCTLPHNGIQLETQHNTPLQS